MTHRQFVQYLLELDWTQLIEVQFPEDEYPDGFKYERGSGYAGHEEAVSDHLCIATKIPDQNTPVEDIAMVHIVPSIAAMAKCLKEMDRVVFRKIFTGKSGLRSLEEGVTSHVIDNGMGIPIRLGYVHLEDELAVCIEILANNK